MSKCLVQSRIRLYSYNTKLVCDPVHLSTNFCTRNTFFLVEGTRLLIDLHGSNLNLDIISEQNQLINLLAVM